MAPAMKETMLVCVLDSVIACQLTPTNTTALSPDRRLGGDDCGKDSKESAERCELGHFAALGLVEGELVSWGFTVVARKLYSPHPPSEQALAGSEHHSLEYPANTRAEGAERRRCRSVVTTDGGGDRSWGPAFTRTRSTENENKRRCVPT